MTTQIQAITILAGLEAYLRALQAASDKEFQTEYPNIWARGEAPKFEYTRGPKWYKVLRVDAQKSVFCFIHPLTGDIYKAATWSTPAKGIRGNIFSPAPPLTEGSLYR